MFRYVTMQISGAVHSPLHYESDILRCHNAHSLKPYEVLQKLNSQSKKLVQHVILGVYSFFIRTTCHVRNLLVQADYIIQNLGLQGVADTQLTT